MWPCRALVHTMISYALTRAMIGGRGGPTWSVIAGRAFQFGMCHRPESPRFLFTTFHSRPRDESTYQTTVPLLSILAAYRT